VTLQAGTSTTNSATFDGSAWSAVTVPTGLKGTACAGAVGFAGGALVYSGCYADNFQTWVFDGSSWSAKAAGGPGRPFSAMARANNPNQVFMTGGDASCSTYGCKGDWLASWTIAGGWQTELAPATLLGTVPNESFTIFNVGDTAYAIDFTRKTRKWNGADWAEVVGAGPAPDPSAWSTKWTSRSVATDGKQTLLQLRPATYSWDGKSWTLISADPACDTGRIPATIANIGPRFFLFCVPTTGETTPWQVKEWK